MFKKVLLVLFSIFIFSCKGLYQNVPGCKGVRTINYDNYVKKDSNTVNLKASLKLLDEIIGKSIMSGGDNIDVATNSTVTKELRTPNEVVTAYNAKINLFCNQKNELLRIAKDDSFNADFRKEAQSKYFEVIEDYRKFSLLLDGQIEKKN